MGKVDAESSRNAPKRERGKLAAGQEHDKASSTILEVADPRRERRVVLHKLPALVAAQRSDMAGPFASSSSYSYSIPDRCIRGQGRTTQRLGRDGPLV